MGEFKAVTRQDRCPICFGADKCSRKADGLIVCGRPQGEQPGFRYLGPAKNDPQWGLYRPLDVPEPRALPPAAPGGRRGPADWSRYVDACKSHLDDGMRQQVADWLGVPLAGTLAVPGLGYDPKRRAFTFPETDARGRVVGVLRRKADGLKRMIQGSKRGLTIDPAWRDRTDPVLVVEGPSDVIALRAAGLCGVGRPSNTGGGPLLAQLFAGLPRGREVLVVGENDAKQTGQWPGKDGAVFTAERLAAALGRPVGWSLPPDGAKDTRGWFVARWPRAATWGPHGPGYLDALRSAAHEVAAPAPAKAPAPAGGLVVVRMSEVTPRPVDWLWRGWLPAGAISLIEGDPGLGKSCVTLDLAARVTTGRPMPWEDGRGQLAGGSGSQAAGPSRPVSQPRDVVFVCGEDAVEEVLHGRLTAVGADHARVHVVRGAHLGGGPEDLRPVMLPDDLAELEAVVGRVAARLVVIDPLMAHLSPAVSAYSDQDVRGVLGRLARLAQQAGCAVVIVRHLTKDADRAAIYRGGGSIGIIGAARAGLLVEEHPAEPDATRVIRVVKCNLAAKPVPRVFRLLKRDGSAGEEMTAVEWGEEYEGGPPRAAGRPRGVTREERCAEVIRRTLAGGPRRSAEVWEACDAAGFRGGLVHRAIKALGVVSVRDVNGWEMRLPPGPEPAG